MQEVEIVHYVMTSFYKYSEPQCMGHMDISSIEPYIQGEATHCPGCGGCTSLLPWLPPHVGEIETRSQRLDDICRCGDEMIVSERFRLLYERENFSGLHGWYPLKIVRVIYRCRPPKTKGNLPIYWVTTVQRSEAHLDDALSNTERYRATPCTLCHGGGIRVIDRVVLAGGATLSMDLSEIHGFRRYIVSDRFRNLCAREEMTGMHFIPLPEYRYRELE